MWTVVLLALTMRNEDSGTPGSNNEDSGTPGSNNEVSDTPGSNDENSGSWL